MIKYARIIESNISQGFITHDDKTALDFKIYKDIVKITGLDELIIDAWIARVGGVMVLENDALTAIYIYQKDGYIVQQNNLQVEILSIGAKIAEIDSSLTVLSGV